MDYLGLLRLLQQIPQTGWLKQKFIAYSSGGQKSKIKVPAWLGSRESLLPGFQTSIFSLDPYMVEKERKNRKNKLFDVSSKKMLIPP